MSIRGHRAPKPSKLEQIRRRGTGVPKPRSKDRADKNDSDREYGQSQHIRPGYLNRVILLGLTLHPI